MDGVESGGEERGRGRGKAEILEGNRGRARIARGIGYGKPQKIMDETEDWGGPGVRKLAVVGRRGGGGGGATVYLYIYNMFVCAPT